ncbi:NCAIR mutase (PurE)-related protein [Chitinispirillum alkaliphilum]|nr:NCAIR mutase (PurE)-related protein [Chitinispirillum alkaliphilum]
MDNFKLETLLNQLKAGNTTVEKVISELRDITFENLDFAKVDHHRALRKGFPEVIFCQNKTAEHVVRIAKAQIAHDETVFGTRATEEILNAVEQEIDGIQIDRQSKLFFKKSPYWRKKEDTRGYVLVCSAGTSDLPVAGEALRTLDILGHPVRELHDVGVAGIHRLFAHRETILGASVLIVVAGMEGALPSVVTGFVKVPVIGVPTSVGYGSHLNGLVPMFAMLNSCASGLTVVNIDNGFGAGCAAAAINGN